MTAARRQVRHDPPLMTADEFFDMPDDGTGNKYELVDGVLVAMAPPMPTHGRLQIELGFLIRRHLKDTKSRCWIASEIGVQPKLKGKTNVRVPDLGVSCKPQVLSDKAMPEPNLLVEILSPSTEKADEAKVWLYATIPSVQEILLVHSTKLRLELYQRLPDGAWPKDAIIARAGQSITLGCIDMMLSADELYLDIPLED
jgi:Uma2 family endonuclease